VFVKQAGKWMIVATHGTPIPPPKSAQPPKK